MDLYEPEHVSSLVLMYLTLPNMATMDLYEPEHVSYLVLMYVTLPNMTHYGPI